MRNYLKWAGSKARLAKQIKQHAPKNYTRLIDPFCGANHMLHILKPETAVLSDINWRLVETHRAVQQMPVSVFGRLRQMETFYNRSDDKRGAYNTIRARFNMYSDQEPSRIAAWFIFLNRMGYNGLYRENNGGGFNVPWGQKETAVLPGADVILDHSERLKNVTFLSNDFRNVLNASNVQDGDFLVFDPPYYPPPTSTAHKYYGAGFPQKSQVELEAIASKFAASGVPVMAFNRDCPLAREAWQGWRVVELSVANAISRDGNSRGARRELVFLGY